MTLPTGRTGTVDTASEPVRLEPGDHLDRATFHARYKSAPEQVRAELVEGTVYMPSPTQRRHGRRSVSVVTWLGTYESATPGVEALDNATILLAASSTGGEPEPDACLLIRPECGGQTTVDQEDYVVGAPELVVEVASSSASIDLHAKKRDYEQAGVGEYVVVLAREARLEWFVRREGGFAPAAAGADGLFRSELFPGLWLDAAALVRGDTGAVLAALQRGLATTEHAAFVARLGAGRTGQNDE